MKVVILAGGYGTRFSEKTKDIPKPLIEIGGRPIIWHIMKIYSYYGFNEFIICLGYKGELIKDYFYNLNIKNNDIRIDYTNGFKVKEYNNKVEPWKIDLIDTGLNTMTGGRLKRIAPYLDDEKFMFTYGDGLSNVDINKLLEKHEKNNTILTVTGVKPQGRFGNMNIEGDIISGFGEKTVNKNEWINGGFFVANNKIFDYIDGDSTVLEEEPLKTLAENKQMGVYKHYGFWKPMDMLKEMNELEMIWQSGNVPWKIWS